ncbi:uncharacterized protein LY79DRAFT_681496 [Colletotrichum navitas]|uniref:Uncharacterized protein n=1 Tax=Colletotrichum navitas TaxID=681940 RepID=A0AAD8Q3N6_9PEZI|nr:uncharacterized protein LY79DRAFT_681496 [Colletotrichum navitas]KAK1595260.1 hypothetical protein LY79DRAFT_681496 [Colletotrichum navitas]
MRASPRTLTSAPQHASSVPTSTATLGVPLGGARRTPLLFHQGAAGGSNMAEARIPTQSCLLPLPPRVGRNVKMGPLEVIAADYIDPARFLCGQQSALAAARTPKTVQTRSGQARVQRFFSALFAAASTQMHGESKIQCVMTTIPSAPARRRPRTLYLPSLTSILGSRPKAIPVVPTRLATSQARA